jgi:hypothetical protein
MPVWSGVSGNDVVDGAPSGTLGGGVSIHHHDFTAAFRAAEALVTVRLVFLGTPEI